MKLSLAVALSHDPKLLILDEATAGLDPVGREEVLELLSDFVSKNKRGILLSSHITGDIEKVADELVFIKNGEILLNVTKDELLKQYVILQCQQSEFQQIDKNLVLAYQNKTNAIEVLVSKSYIEQVPTTWIKKEISIDDITLLLMRGKTA